MWELLLGRKLLLLGGLLELLSSSHHEQGIQEERKEESSPDLHDCVWCFRFVKVSSSFAGGNG